MDGKGGLGAAGDREELARLFAAHVLPKPFASKYQKPMENRAKWVEILKAKILKTEMLRVQIARRVTI